jgi:hypothetical protein
MAEDDKNASLSTTTKHLTTSFDRGCEAMETNCACEDYGD